MELQFSERLEALMREQGLQSGVQLVSRMHDLGVAVNPMTVERWLAGNRKPDFENLAAVASALGVSADYLLGLTNERADLAQAANG